MEWLATAIIIIGYLYNINVLGILLIIAAIISLVISGIAWLRYCDLPDHKKDSDAGIAERNGVTMWWKYTKIFFITGIVIVVTVPTTNTMYAALGVYAAGETVESEIGKKALEALELKFDEVINQRDK